MVKQKHNATCRICGKGYYMCLSCKDMIALNPWKIHTDTSEHYKIYQVIHGYSTGVFDKNEAKRRLSTIDLSDFDKLRDNIKDIIANIKSEDNEPDNVVSSDKLEGITDNSVTEKTKTTRRKKSFDVVETEV